MPDDTHGRVTAKEDWNVGDMLTADWANVTAHLANRNADMPFNLGSMQRAISVGSNKFQSTDIPDVGIPFYNADGTTIPAYGVVLITGFQSVPGGGYPSCQKPNTYGCQTNFLVNSAAQVFGTNLGYAQFQDRPMIAAWDPQDGFTPNPGEMWGVQSGSYLIRKNYGGFRITGVYDSTNHLAEVRSEPMYLMLCKTTSTLPAHSSNQSFPLNIFVGDVLSEFQPAGNPTQGSVFNYTNCNIGSGKFVICRLAPWSPSGWWLAQIADTS